LFDLFYLFRTKNDQTSRSRRALHNGAPGGGPLLPPEHALQNAASGGATFRAARAISLQLGRNDF
jgi:hypothetical protein